jgi:hypothetical protein
VWTFYRYGRDSQCFLESSTSVSRRSYFRLLAVGCLDIVITLPIGVLSVALDIATSLQQGEFPFYWGWGVIHSDWGPFGVSYNEEIRQSGFWDVFGFYVSIWSSIVLGFAIVALFGFTPEARATYWRAICALLKVFGWKLPVRFRPQFSAIEFNAKGDHEQV